MFLFVCFFLATFCFKDEWNKGLCLVQIRLDKAQNAWGFLIPRAFQTNDLHGSYLSCLGNSVDWSKEGKIAIGRDNSLLLLVSQGLNMSSPFLFWFFWIFIIWSLGLLTDLALLFQFIEILAVSFCRLSIEEFGEYSGCLLFVETWMIGSFWYLDKYRWNFCLPLILKGLC